MNFANLHKETGYVTAPERHYNDRPGPVLNPEEDKWAEGLSPKNFYDGTQVFHLMVVREEAGRRVMMAACSRKLCTGNITTEIQ
jgi:hypothetical protein